MTGAPARPRIVILGGGFAGLAAARGLRRAAADVTLVDSENFHLFQPLLYQVAIGGLAPADIAAPLRGILRRQKNVRVWLGRAVELHAEECVVEVRAGDGLHRLAYDHLIVATGSRTHYFGNDEWAAHAPPLKDIADATEMRRRILGAFEQAELEPDARRRARLATFVVVGGGPTGVELAGAVSELARRTLRRDFRSFDPASSTVVLLEGGERLLATYSEKLSADACRMLEELGVDVRLSAQVVSIDAEEVAYETDGERVTLPTATVLWAAGVGASPWGQRIADAVGLELERGGRVPVDEHLAVPGHPKLRVIGDLAFAENEAGEALPGVAPVAIQQGEFVAKDLARMLAGKHRKPFRYRDKGNLATIGRSAAVAQIGRLETGGGFAWLLWLGVHLAFLIGFANRIIVLFKWALAYLTFTRGSRLILPSKRAIPLPPPASAPDPPRP